MEKWNGTVLDINAAVSNLHEKCYLMIGMHCLSGCDTVSYQYGQGKSSGYKVLMNHDAGIME